MQFFALPSALVGLVVAFVLPLAGAQYPPPPVYQNVLTSPLNSNITVAYKHPDPGTCTTAFTTQQQYSGYIGLPPFTLAPIQQNYSINTFFWFVEARQTPEAAPLTIWLNGGPGSSSMIGFFNEMGPCQVVQTDSGSYGTQYSMWGWDRSSNVLFIDQPNLVGFSYDSATNASYDLFTSQVFDSSTPPGTGLPSYMYPTGTFGTANSDGGTSFVAAPNTTAIAARAIWHFLQTWLATFPQYNPAIRPNSTVSNPLAAPVGVNLFTESYGGKFGPEFASYFEEQNALLSNGSLPSNTTLAIQLESVGIMNGLIDDAIQDFYYPSFAFNNTYGIQAISQTDELNALQDFSGTDMCLSQIEACRAALNSTDPEGFGDVTTTNELCEQAQFTCGNVTAAYYAAGFDPYDIRQHFPSPDLPGAYQEYLNTASVLASIGAVVNYTESSRYVQAGFISTGDTIRGGQIEDIASLLSMGIRVALIYGDADFICNWFGGEAVSLAIAAQLSNYPAPSSSNAAAPVPTPYASAFPAAGYAEIVVNSSYVGGAVRQYGNLSFSRIYDSGHFVPYFQPETAFTVFTRVIQGTDIATGEIVNLESYGSTGPANATFTNTASSATPLQTCWIRSLNDTCSESDLTAMLAGQGTVQFGVFYQDDSSATLPSSSVAAGMPGDPMETGIGSAPVSDGGSGTGRLTGVFTATSTPSPTDSAAVAYVRPLSLLDARAGAIAVCTLAFAIGILVVL